MNKKLIIAALTLIFILAFTGCGKDSKASDDDKTIKVGANIVPHAEILEYVKPILKEKGYTLEIVKLEDSITPNTGVIEGSLDANYISSTFRTLSSSTRRTAATSFPSVRSTMSRLESTLVEPRI